MTTYTVTLSISEDIALGAITASQAEWIDNVVHNRCRLAIDAVVKLAVEKCFEEGIQLPGTKDDVVLLAYQKGWLVNGLPE